MNASPTTSTSPSFSTPASTSPVVRQYFEARKTGIKAALAFDPSGRPGASSVREDQARLKALVAAYRRSSDARLPKPSRAVVYPGDRWNLTKKAWQDHCHHLRQMRVDGFLASIESRKADMADGSPRELFGLVMDSSIYGVGIHRLGNGWFYRQNEEAEADYHAYSKEWHRAHGPKVTISNRRVSFRRINPETGEKEIKTAHMDSWRGDWLAAAVVKAGLQPQNPQAPMSVRLHAAYDAILMSTRHGYRVYRRTLVGKFVDWVIIAPLGTTYHSQDSKALLAGVHAKIRASKARLEGRMIDWAKCRKLGFCEAGIRAFCDLFGLDSKGSYTPEEIERVVRANPSAAAPYLPELRTLAEAVGFVVQEFTA